jgi:hypothetical protein
MSDEGAFLAAPNPTSELGHKRRFCPCPVISGLSLTADMEARVEVGRYGPLTEVADTYFIAAKVSATV